MTRRELKLKAKESLRGRWLQIILVTLCVSIVTNIGSSPDFYYTFKGEETSFWTVNLNLIINLILGGIISLIFCKYLLNFIDTTKNSEFEDLFSYGRFFFKALALNFLIGLLVFIGILLLVVPGVILSYCYSQAFYILAEDPELSIIECMQKSRHLMEGHKGELFLLDLSFMGWYILGIIPLGLGLLWVVPYDKVTKTYYYLYIKGENSLY